MNLFILDTDPIIAASYAYDCHAVKMPLEGLQMLCTNARLILGEENTQHSAMMQSTHANHPSTLWGRSSAYNFAWLLTNTEALFKEYTKRYKRTHASEPRLIELMPLFDSCIDALEDITLPDLTPFALAMPDNCLRACPVESYRAYYKHKAQQEIDKAIVYNVLVKRGCKPRKPALRFVWNKTDRPEWATYDTAEKFLK